MPKKTTRKPDTTNQARLVQLVHLIKQLQPVPFNVLMERLEVSRATLRRDFDLLRDRLNMPIVYDRYAGGYAISEKTDRYGDRFELPGLWLTADEGYAFLTLFNVLGKIDPGILNSYVAPLRGVIKRVLCDKKFDMLGLNDKIVIELGDFKKGRQPIFESLSKAVMNENKVQIQFAEDSQNIPGEYWLERFVLTPNGWDIDAYDVQTKNKLLNEACHKYNVNLSVLVAATGLWANKQVHDYLKNENGTGAYYPNMRRLKPGEIKGSNLDDNTYANTAIKKCLGIKEKILGYQTCHIWEGTTYDCRYHTAVANLVLLPRPLASLSDYDPQVQAVLKYRSYELYGWYPENQPCPEKPPLYEKNIWKEPYEYSEIVKKALSRRKK